MMCEYERTEVIFTGVNERTALGALERVCDLLLLPKRGAG